MKRIAVIILSVVLATIVLAGCGSDKSQKNDPSQKSVGIGSDKPELNRGAGPGAIR